MKNLNHVVMGLAPVADAFNGAAVYSDVINMKNWGHIQFLVVRGAAGGAGTATITVEACDDTTPSTTVAVPFTYQLNTATDVYAAHAEASASGVLFTAGANLILKVDVDVEALLASGYSYIRLKSSEVGDFTYVGCILAILTEGRVEEDIPATAIT